MDLIDTVYSVSLHDYPSDLRTADRVRIETRYAAELERAFGSPDNVAAVLDTMESLQSSPPDILSPGDLQLVQHWAKASVGDAEGCYFDVERVPF